MKERFTLVFLVLLRMAIGWHFLFEGCEKERSVVLGETTRNKVWTSEPYFREGTGPMARLVRSKIGDADDLLLARLTARDADSAPPSKLMPELLDREWDEYLDRFSKHFGLDGDRLEIAKKVLQQEKDQTVIWLTLKPGSIAWVLSGMWTDFDHVPFKRTYPGGSYEVDESVSDRVEEYRHKVEEYRSLQNQNSAFGRDVEKARRAVLRGDVMALRTELLVLLDKRESEMKKSLADSVLTKEELKDNPPVPALKKHWTIRWIDFSTRWALMLIGAGLLLGLFSRLSALGGAAFLVMTLLTHPPLPWLPEPPNVEGHYVFISKNVIELLALLMLACIPSGRWFGLDALIHALNPWRKRDEE